MGCEKGEEEPRRGSRGIWEGTRWTVDVAREGESGIIKGEGRQSKWRKTGAWSGAEMMED